MNPKINQRLVISHLNRYLDWHNLPVRMNHNGICNGLAAVFVKYALQGKLRKFNHLLKQMATLSANTEYDEEINEFAKEVAASFMPENRNKQLNQLHAISTLSIDGKPLTSSYDLAMTTSESNWASILKEIQLQDDEVMMVRSINHVASICKKNGTYLIYDPNYSQGFKIFASEEAVIDELRSHVFPYTGPKGTHPLNLNKDLLQAYLDEGLNLHVQVIRHPSSPTRTFPDITQLYNTYLTSQNEAVKYISINMYWAILMDNKDLVNALYAQGFNQSPVAACLAAANNSTEILPFLLKKIEDPNYLSIMPAVFIHALMNGRKEALDILLKDKNGQDCFKDIILQRGNAATFIHQAAQGGNEEILEFILDAYRHDGQPQLCDEDIANIARAAMQTAINSQSVACVNLLYQQLKKVPGALDEELLLTHLLNAIKANQPSMVRFFIDEVYRLPHDQQVIFEAIALSTSRVEKTDISILRLLQANHVCFSKTAQAVIDSKEKRPGGFLMPMGILLYKFSDFIKEVWLKRDEITENISHFKKMKAGFFKPEPTQETNESLPINPLPIVGA